MTKDLIQEFTFRIAAANRTELVVIYYDMALEYIREAKRGYRENDIPAAEEGIRKARACVDSLLQGLDYQYGLAQNLMQLYLYVNRELNRARIKKNPELLDHAAPVIEGLKSAFMEVSRQDSSGPVMEHAQTVYAGLTYGRNSLNESMGNPGGSRGFCV